MWIPVAFCWVGFAVCAIRDPRQLRAGLWLLAALGTTVLVVAGRGLTHAIDKQQNWIVQVVVIFAGLLALGVLALAVALVLNGVTMLRREGHRAQNLLSGLLGLAMIAYAVLCVAALVTSSTTLFALGFTLLLPIGYLGTVFIALLLWSWLYQRIARLYRRPAAVVVLGAGLIRGAVTPLLASRLDAGARVYARALTAGRTPELVTSGGQGPDEPRAEALAMADYLLDHGVDADEVVVETRSRNTRENLLFTKRILTDRGTLTPRPPRHRVHLPVRPRGVVVVTSNYHAFRTATLMRAVGLRGQAVGAPTAAYYWPSATIREFAALLRDHWVVNLVGLGVFCLPLLGYLVETVVAALR